MTKLRSQDELVFEVQRLKREGKTVALANGVFDLLHVGHVRYLEGARALADVLVVAVNSDPSARAVKGPGRPIVPANERAELIAALTCTDFVLLFDRTSKRISPSLVLEVSTVGATSCTIRSGCGKLLGGATTSVPIPINGIHFAFVCCWCSSSMKKMLPAMI